MGMIERILRKHRAEQGDDLQELVPFANPDVQAAFDKAVEEEKEKDQKNAVAEWKHRLANYTRKMEEHVSVLRDARKIERKQKKHIKQTERAWKYAVATGNPVPFDTLSDPYLARLRPDGCTKEEWKAISEIPEDWTPPAE